MNKVGVVGIILVILLVIIVVVGLYLYYSKKIKDVFSENIYLDNNGTTQPYGEVIEAMSDYSKLGNSSSTYAEEAKKITEVAEKLILNAVYLPVTRKVIFTSCASESNNLFFRSIVDHYWSTAGKSGWISDVPLPHLIVSAIEHSTSIECVKQLAEMNRAEVTFIDPKMDGTIDPIEISYAIKPNTIGISVMHINNETGAMNQLNDIATIARAKNILFHADIVQSFGKIYTGSRPDAMSISFHKIHGPVGVGALVVSESLFDKIKKVPQICGSQNLGARGGTQNIAGIAGTIEAVRIFTKNRCVKNKKIIDMKKYVVDFLAKKFSVDRFENYYGKSDSEPPHGPTDLLTSRNFDPRYHIVFLGPITSAGLPDPDRASPFTLLVSFVKNMNSDSESYKHFCNVKLKNDLLKKKIIVSIGSACSGPNNSSHVLKAMKAPFIIRCGVIRISFGDFNNMKDIINFCDTLYELVGDQYNK